MKIDRRTHTVKGNELPALIESLCTLTGIRYSEDPESATVMAPLVDHLILEVRGISKVDATLTYPPTERDATILAPKSIVLPEAR